MDHVEPSGSDVLPGNKHVEEGSKTTGEPVPRPPKRRFAIPREFTNYDRNAHTWRNGSALEILERSAKPPTEVKRTD